MGKLKIFFEKLSKKEQPEESTENEVTSYESLMRDSEEKWKKAEEEYQKQIDDLADINDRISRQQASSIQFYRDLFKRSGITEFLDEETKQPKENKKGQESNTQNTTTTPEKNLNVTGRAIGMAGIRGERDKFVSEMTGEEILYYIGLGDLLIQGRDENNLEK